MSFVSQLSGLKGRWSWRRFESATRHPEEVQWYLLLAHSEIQPGYGVRQGTRFFDDAVGGRFPGRRTHKQTMSPSGRGSTR